MRRSTITILIIILIVVIAGVAIATNNSNSKNNTQPTSNNTNSQPTNNSSQQSNGASNESTSGAVEIRNMMFTPSQITIAKGGTVTWTNNDSTTHTVVDDLSNVDGPKSGDIAPGKTYSFTFNTAGSFQYHCSIHPSMRGTIVVK